MTLITRAAWGARPPKSTGNLISAHPLGVAVHYSAANLGSSPDSLCDDKVRGIQNYHMDHNGWADIAYSFLACPHGNLFEGRGTGKGSAANGTTQANLDYYAVCALGGPADKPSLEMLSAIGLGIGRCRKAGAALKVIGHRDLFPTACPGTALYAFVTADHWKTIPTTPTPEVDMPLTQADADLIVHSLLVTQLGSTGPNVAVALQTAAGAGVAPASVAAIAAAVVALLPAGGSAVTAAQIAKAVNDDAAKRLLS
jgi:hypothetical protein